MYRLQLIFQKIKVVLKRHILHNTQRLKSK